MRPGIEPRFPGPLANTLPNMFTVQLIGLMGRMFANGPGERGSIPGHVIPQTQKMVVGTSLLNTQHYKVRIKGKVARFYFYINYLFAHGLNGFKYCYLSATELQP